MIPQRLQLSNFMSYKNADLSFVPFDLVVFSGKNGAGKSTLLEAMTWALWGKTRMGEDADSLVHQGEHEMWVEFIFDLEKNRYRVVRKRETAKTGKTTLIYQIAAGKKMLEDEQWQNISEATIKETQEKIITTLHLPYEIFINSSYLRQGKADEFTIKAPTKRKEILAQILNLDYYDELQEKAKEKKKEATTQIKTIKYRLENLQNIIAEREQVEREYKVVEKEKKILETKLLINEAKIKKMITDRQRLIETKNKKEELLIKWNEITAEIKNLGQENNEKQKEIEKLNKLCKKEKDINQEYDKLIKLQLLDRDLNEKKDELNKLQRQLSPFSALKNRLKEDIENIRHISTCPTCKRKMTEKEAQKIIKELKNDFIKKYVPDYQKISLVIKKIAYSESKHNQIKKQLEELENIVFQKHEIDKAKFKIKEFEQTITNNNDKVKQNRDKLKKIKLEGTKYHDLEKGLETKTKGYARINSELEDIKENYSNNNQSFGQLSEKLNQIQKAQTEIKELESKHKQLNEREGAFEKLVEIFGKNGIQTMIIEQTLPSIEEETNKLLAIISQGLKAQFLTKRAKKSGDELIDTLDIKITDSAGQRPYELFSGGEAFRINFAIRIAISKVLSNRSGAKLQFLAIDEGFGALDQTGKNDVIAAISSIRSDFDKIVIVTHLEELKDAFPYRVEIIKDENTSLLQINP